MNFGVTGNGPEMIILEFQKVSVLFHFIRFIKSDLKGFWDFCILDLTATRSDQRNYIFHKSRDFGHLGPRVRYPAICSLHLYQFLSLRVGIGVLDSVKIPFFMSSNDTKICFSFFQINN